MNRYISILVAFTLTLVLSACAGRGAPYGQSPYGSAPNGQATAGQGYNAYPYQYVPQPGQGQYVRPDYLNPTPTPRIPRADLCQSKLYQGLVGQNEGAIYIAGLPGRKRVLKPAFLEDFDGNRVEGIDPEPPFIEVRDYLPQQVLYAPSIRTVSDRIQLGPEDERRLTIELDDEGYVQEISCG
jgi:hypothetical protein